MAIDGRRHSRILSFAVNNPAAVRAASNVRADGAGIETFTLTLPNGAIDVELPLSGPHNALNAAAAAAVAHGTGHPAAIR